MKLKRIVFIVLMLLPAAYVACLRLNPGLAMAWREHVSLPLLSLMRVVGDSLPFSLLESSALLLAAILAACFAAELLRRGAARALSGVLRRIVCLLLALLWLYLGMWYPLYFGKDHVCEVGSADLAANCEILIERLNASPLVFEQTMDLPVKRAVLPVWLRAGRLAGFCAFFTGEAFVDPDLPDCTLPFVAMHERMHLLGHAGEGAANIAAWQVCMELGGPWAESAMLWALHYSMGSLREMNPIRHASLVQAMDDATYAAFLRCGGSSQPSPLSGAMQWLCTLLGISESVQDYDILASYLAAAMPRCYNDL